MNKPHKHKDVIIAYANGAQIQYREPKCSGWKDIQNPSFSEIFEYRAKPEKKTGWLNVYKYSGALYESRELADDLKSPNRIACIQVSYEEGEGL